MLHGIAQAPHLSGHGGIQLCGRARACSAKSPRLHVGVALEQRGLGPERGDVLEVRRVVDVAGIPRIERRLDVSAPTWLRPRAPAIAIPIAFTRATSDGASLPTGSENGGSQMRVGNGPDRCT
jgi:hypothetical protein